MQTNFTAVALLCTTALCVTCRDKTAMQQAKLNQRPVAVKTSQSSASPVWEPAGFGGAGNFLSVHVDPKQPAVVYAASDVAGVFRSTDGGEHWQMRNVGLGNYEVSSLAIDPTDSNRLYVGVGANRGSQKGGVYRSDDAGTTWRHLPASQRAGIRFRRWRTVDAIAVDPHQKNVVLSGSVEKGIFRSTDAGQSWTAVFAAPVTRAKLTTDEDDDAPKAPYPAPVSVIIFDPQDPQLVYAALDGSGVARSRQGGVAGSWQLINTGLPAMATVKSLSIGKNGALYAALGRQGIYVNRDRNYGARWQKTSGQLPFEDEEDWVSAVVVDRYSETEAVYAVLATYSYPNIWKSTNGGRHWLPQACLKLDQQQNPTRLWANQPTMAWYATINPHRPEQLFFTNYWSVLRSEDAGQCWHDKIVGAQNSCVTSLIVTGHAGQQRLFATHMDAGILMRDSGGTSQNSRWKMLFPKTEFDPLRGHFWSLLSVQIDGRAVLYATGDPWGGSDNKRQGVLMRSQDDGETWSAIFKLPRPEGTWMDGAMLGLAAHPQKTKMTPATMYLTQDGGAVWISEDGGQKFRRTATQPQGNSFTQALAVDAQGDVYVGTLRHGLWRSQDKGKTWQRLLTERDSIWRIVIDDKRVYAAVGDDAQLYLSQDRGNTWQALGPKSRQADVGDEVAEQGMSVAIDPHDRQHLLFGRRDTWHSSDASSGVWETFDGGKSWQVSNAGLGVYTPHALAFGQDNTVYLGAWCGGIWKRTYKK